MTPDPLIPIAHAICAFANGGCHCANRRSQTRGAVSDACLSVYPAARKVMAVAIAEVRGASDMERLVEAVSPPLSPSPRRKGSKTNAL